jgi:hypothetical protein
MSVTFYFPDDEQVTDTFGCCDHKHCPHCHGSGSVSFQQGKHEMNMANGNAMLILRVLGLPEDYAGEIHGNVLAYKAMGAINRLAHVAKHERPTTVEGEGPTIVHMGLSSEQICQRLNGLQRLGAAAGTQKVYWS